MSERTIIAREANALYDNGFNLNTTFIGKGALLPTSALGTWWCRAIGTRLSIDYATFRQKVGREFRRLRIRKFNNPLAACVDGVVRSGRFGAMTPADALCYCVAGTFPSTAFSDMFETLRHFGDGIDAIVAFNRDIIQTGMWSGYESRADGYVVRCATFTRRYVFGRADDNTAETFAVDIAHGREDGHHNTYMINIRHLSRHELKNTVAIHDTHAPVPLQVAAVPTATHCGPAARRRVRRLKLYRENYPQISACVVKDRHRATWRASTRMRNGLDCTFDAFLGHTLEFGWQNMYDIYAVFNLAYNEYRYEVHQLKYVLRGVRGLHCTGIIAEYLIGDGVRLTEHYARATSEESKNRIGFEAIAQPTSDDSHIDTCAEIVWMIAQGIRRGVWIARYIDIDRDFDGDFDGKRVLKYAVRKWRRDVRHNGKIRPHTSADYEQQIVAYWNAADHPNCSLGCCQCLTLLTVKYRALSAHTSNCDGGPQMCNDCAEYQTVTDLLANNNYHDPTRGELEEYVCSDSDRDDDSDRGWGNSDYDE